MDPADAAPGLSASALLELMWLASPTLPVGGFSYSEGLEAAVDAGLVRDEAQARDWLTVQLQLTLARSDLAVVAQAIRAWRGEPATCTQVDTVPTVAPSEAAPAAAAATATAVAGQLAGAGRAATVEGGPAQVRGSASAGSPSATPAPTATVRTPQGAEVEVARIVELNTWVRLTRETSELRQQTEQMGRSLLEWLRIQDGQPKHTPPVDATAALPAPAPDARLAVLAALKPAPTWPVAHALALARSDAPLREALLAHGFGWVENMVQAALKAVPLGQSAGQRILAALVAVLPEAVDQAMRLGDAERQSHIPMLAILSARHEVQYSRLFRS